MSFRPDEVSAVIKEELRKYTTTLELEDRGYSWIEEKVANA